MKCRLPTKQGPGIPAIVAQRCEELGLLVWRIDAQGEIRQAPAEAAGLVTPEQLRQAAGAWAGEPEPSSRTLAEGLWLLPVPETHRRQRTGYLVALADAREGGGVVHAASVPMLHQVLRWMALDVTETEQQLREIEGFTSQLTDAYETIHTLYGIGRAMGQVISPELFMNGTVEELHQTLPFGWIACITAEDATGNPAIDGQVILRGELPGGTMDDVRASAWTAALEAEADHALLLPVPEGLPESLGPQLVVQPSRRGGRLCAILVAGSKRGAEREASSYETLMMEATGGFLRAFLDNVALYAEQEATFIGTVKGMTAAIDAKDRYTRGHSERVALLSRQLAEAAGLSERDVHEVYISGLVHDVGKIGVPEAVLCKNGRLDDAEFGLIRLHPEIGHEILRDIPSLATVLPGVLHHHERWDGEGYPHGLAGEGIPLMARIIGLADTFDAMSSTRSYRPAMPRDRVLEEIAKCAGTQFDPDLARLFESLNLEPYDAMVARHRAADPVFHARAEAA